MRKSRLIRGLLLGCIAMLLEGNVVAISANASTMTTIVCAEEVTIESIGDNSRAAQLIWYYKEENGKKYRRLYDGTNEVWLTDWILCE